MQERVQVCSVRHRISFVENLLIWTLGTIGILDAP